MDLFKTNHTYLGHNEDVHVCLMELVIILTKLQTFIISYFDSFFCNVGYGVCVINSSYCSFQ